MQNKEDKGHKYKPETLMMSYGYDPTLSEGSAKPPVFLTSTFVFPNAQKGKDNFQITFGLRDRNPGEIEGLIYSRMNNPNLQMLEERIALWDDMDKSLVFSSGMAAISTFVLSATKPGDAIVATTPMYGGTYFLLEEIMPKFNIKTYTVEAGSGKEKFEEAIKKAQADGRNVKFILVETPSNPTNIMTDLETVSEVAKKYSTKTNRILSVVDNTFLGPVFQAPKKFGADVIIYSATKFIGGHSDLVAGVVSLSEDIAKSLLFYRSMFGTMGNPFDSWLMLRSLETLKIRMEEQCKGAQKIATFLSEHPKVEEVIYPGLLNKGSKQHDIYKKQTTGPGSLITFKLKGGENDVFKLLNSLKLFKLAVSLGGTESLIEHPRTMTHADIPLDQQELQGIYENTLRISVGIENPDDLIFDLKQNL